MATELHAFFDKDIFIKLACCDIWADTQEALGVTHPYRLASATPTGSKTALRRMVDIPDSLREATKARLAAMAVQVPVVPDNWVSAASISDLYNAMIATDNIDSGEAELAIVAMHCEYENKLVTGDKRFMAAMAQAFPKEFERLRPALVSFEQCLQAVCVLRGFDAVRGRLLAAKGCDRTLKLALGADGLATFEAFSAALISFGSV
jgi:hypothetical protein